MHTFLGQFGCSISLLRSSLKVLEFIKVSFVVLAIVYFHRATSTSSSMAGRRTCSHFSEGHIRELELARATGHNNVNRFEAKTKLIAGQISVRHSHCSAADG